MRLAFSLFGFEVWAVEASAATVEVFAEENPCETEAGSFTSYPVGFAPNIVPDWEKSLTSYDEPGDDDEDWMGGPMNGFIGIPRRPRGRLVNRPSAAPQRDRMR